MQQHLWVQGHICIWPLSSFYCMWYHVILNCVIKRPNCVTCIKCCKQQNYCYWSFYHLVYCCLCVAFCKKHVYIFTFHIIFQHFGMTMVCSLRIHWGLNKMFFTLRPRQNGRLFADNIFTCIFLNEKVWIWINISLKFVPKGQINNIPVFVQIMAWRRPGDKPLSELMMFSLLTHKCVTRPQWVKR